MSDTTAASPAPANRFSAALWRELREPRDPFLEDAAASGELLVARIRLALLAFILIIQLLPGWDPRVLAVGLTFNIVALVWAALAITVVRSRYRPWMGFVSSVVDVSLVSAGLSLYQAKRAGRNRVVGPQAPDPEQAAI